jgi:hypothetical protein
VAWQQQCSPRSAEQCNLIKLDFTARTLILNNTRLTIAISLLSTNQERMHRL